jgi:hypothetical protein
LQLRVLRSQHPRFAATPALDDEDVIRALAILARIWFLKDGDLLKDIRFDAYLFHHLAGQGVRGRLTGLAVSTNEVPDSWIELSIVGPLRQKYLALANEHSDRASPGSVTHPVSFLLHSEYI